MARAPEAPAGHGQSGRVALRPAQGQAEVMVDQPVGISQEGLRQVVHAGPDACDALVGEALPAAAHGENVHRKPQLFKEQDFVGDEGFGDAGIAFEHHPQHRPSRNRHGLWHLKSCSRCFMVSSPVSANAAMASRWAAGLDRSSISFSRSRPGSRLSQEM